MALMNRRDLLKLGLAASAVVGTRPHDAGATEDKNVLPAGHPLDVAAHLTKLRARPRHLGPPSPQLTNALERIPRPVLVYDLSQIEENFLTFLEAKKELEVHYAIKCCPNPLILQRIASLGGGFDVASPAELDLALDTGVLP